MAGWCADYPEHITLQCLQSGFCQWCEVEKSEFGSGFLPEKTPLPLRDHSLYQDLWLHKKFDILLTHGVNPIQNALWGIGLEVHHLPKPDLLHTIWLGMMKHLMEWLLAFLEKHDRLHVFNQIWKTVPPFHDISPVNKTYSEVSQWQGKEIRIMSRYLLAVFTVSLRKPKPSQRLPFGKAIHCTRSLLDFIMCSKLPIHNTASLCQMDEFLQEFHKKKEVFLEFRAGKRTTEESRSLRSQRVQARQEKISGFTKTRKVLELQKYNDRTEVLVREALCNGSHFNFPKLHMLKHFREQIELFGCLEMWSTELGELLHRSLVKDPYQRSNKCGDYTLQILNETLKDDAFIMRQMNIDHAQRHLDMSIAIPDPVPTLRWRLRSLQRGIQTFQQLAKYLAMDPFILAIEKYFRAGPTLPSTLWEEKIAIYHAFDLFITPSLFCPEKETQTIRCTINSSWQSKEPRRDWVWIDKQNHPDERHNNATCDRTSLRDQMAVCIRVIFSILISTGPPRNLAFVETTTTVNGGQPDENSGLIRITKPSTLGAQFRVIELSSVLQAAHVIPIPHVYSTSGCLDGEESEWLVNHYIDLQSWTKWVLKSHLMV